MAILIVAAFSSRLSRYIAAMNLFVDMDGVLADFAQHYQAVFGWRPEIEDNVDWTAVREVEDFYLNIPPMADLELLWDRIERYQPIVLTGVPKEIAEAPRTSALG